MKIHVIDRGATKMLRLWQSKAPSLHVGVIGAEADEIHTDGTATIGEIAAIHEFGLGVPRRSFLGDFVDANAAALSASWSTVQEAGRAAGRPSITAYERFGAWVVGQIQKRIAAHIPPPLAPSTIEAKGSSTPLIDTGALRGAITYKVVP